MTFDHLRRANVSRCSEVFHPLEEWSPTDWACAMGGECGEAQNLIKKLRRGEGVPLSDIADELADLIIYADLLAARLGIDLGNAVVFKFNEVSLKRGASVFLNEPDEAPTTEDEIEALRTAAWAISPTLGADVDEAIQRERDENDR